MQRYTPASICRRRWKLRKYLQQAGKNTRILEAALANGCFMSSPPTFDSDGESGVRRSPTQAINWLQQYPNKYSNHGHVHPEDSQVVGRLQNLQLIRTLQKGVGQRNRIEELDVCKQSADAYLLSRAAQESYSILRRGDGRTSSS